MLHTSNFILFSGGGLKTSPISDVTIVVDAMGGDRAPGAPIEGAVLAARSAGIPIVLVGDEERINTHLEQLQTQKLNISVKHAPEVVGMQDSAVASVKAKPQSSIRIAFDMLDSGEAQALFSAGNTGAVLATSVVVSGRVEGIDRPAVATTLPAINGALVFLDAGANISCRARHLVQFALMGGVFAREIFHVDVPRVGLLSNGAEESKGTDILKKAREKIKALEGIDFVGFIEGDEMVKGNVDVVVTDGFTGNLVLKAIEGIGEFMVDSLADLFHGGALNKLGKAILKARIDSIRDRIDYAHYGGAPLVGARHACVVGHGRSSSEAVSNGIKLAAEFASVKYPDKLKEQLDLQSESLKNGAIS